MRLLLALLACLWLLPPSVFAAAEIPLDSPDGHLPVGQLQYLVGAPELAFAQAAEAQGWQDSRRASLNLRIQRQGAWVRFDVRGAADGQPWNLLIKWPLLDRVDLRLHYPDSQRWSAPLVAGDGVPADSRAVAHRFLVFPLALAAGERATVYLHVDAYEPLMLPMELVSTERLQAEQVADSTLIGVFFGTALVMLLYNLCLFVFTRERSYGFYVLYLGGVLVYGLAVTGFGQLYFDATGPWLAARFYTVSGALTFVFATLFFRNFLELGRIGGWVDWVNRGVFAYWTLISLLFVVAPYTPVLHLLQPQLGGPLSCLIGMASGIALWRRGYAEARLFTIAWSFLIVFTLINLLALDGHLPLNGLTLNSQLIGMALEFTLLAIALVEHINRERGRRLRVQQENLAYADRLAREREEKLHAQQQALRIQRKANEDLERRVDERTRELAEANAQLERLSTLDPLTQLANRRRFEAHFLEELARAKRHHSPLALLMIDVDHFKSINDRYGHPFGDECLRAVAEVLRAHSQRPGDLAARYGGEEFVMILDGTDLAGARHCAEAIRADIAALRLPCGDQEVRLSASLGLVASVPARDVSGETLLARADAALYAAKGNGRNRVCLAAES